MSKILLNTSLVMEHSKTKLFHFTRAWHPPNPFIDLTSVRGPVISPKPIWQYLGFYFDCKLNFNYHTHFYATKCLSTLSTMKMLRNFSRGLLPIQKWLLYRMCILFIALYEFQLWFFKGTPIVKNLTEFKKIQRRAALWIIDAFWTLPSKDIKTIVGLILINLHLQKLNSRHYLCYVSVTNFIRSYLRQFFDDSNGLKASLKPLRRPFDRCQSRLEAINNGRDIKQINW